MTLWKRDYLGRVRLGQLEEEEQMSSQEMLDKIRQQQSQIDYLQRQRRKKGNAGGGRTSNCRSWSLENELI